MEDMDEEYMYSPLKGSNASSYHRKKKYEIMADDDFN